MKKLKIFAICMILSISLVACNNSNKKEDVKKDEVKKEDVKEKEVNKEENMSNKEKKVIGKLLEDVADTDLDRTENEMELVSLANKWITDLKDVKIDLNEVKNITIDYIATAEPTKIGTLKEMFPKLNNYAIGLITGDANTLGLLEGTGEKLEEDILTEAEWVEVYEIILAELNK